MNTSLFVGLNALINVVFPVIVVVLLFLIYRELVKNNDKK